MPSGMLPRTLTLVRHGESESNKAKREAKKGRPQPGEADLMKVHTSRRRLTPKGVRQAGAAGHWLQDHFTSEAFGRGEQPYERVRGFVSPYARAVETAGCTHLPIDWLLDARLCERNWGDLDQLTYEERVAKYGSTDEREHHGIFWPAGNGETLQMVATRVWQHFDMLAREHTEHDVIQVSHGETILTERFMLERWLPEDVVHMMLLTDTKLSREVLGVPTDYQRKLINCRIVQYTREREDGTWDTKYCRVRLVAPLSPKDPNMNLDWQPIERRRFTSAELLEYVQQFPHFLSEAA